MSKHHYYLSAGQITFAQTDEEKKPQGNPVTVMMNGIVRREKEGKTLSLIGAANQSLQQVLFSRLGEEASKIVVLDVIQLNIDYLGHFTEAEFNDLPKAEAANEG